MPDWNKYVRARLRLNGARPQHEREVIDDLAAQLEDAYREAIARGLSDAEADASFGLCCKTDTVGGLSLYIRHVPLA